MQVNTINSVQQYNKTANVPAFKKLEYYAIEGLIKKKPTKEEAAIIEAFKNSKVVKAFCEKFNTHAWFTTIKNNGGYECRYSVFYKEYPESNKMFDRLKAHFTKRKEIGALGYSAPWSRDSAGKNALERFQDFECRLADEASKLERAAKERKAKKTAELAKKQVKADNEMSTKTRAKGMQKALDEMMQL